MVRVPLKHGAGDQIPNKIIIHSMGEFIGIDGWANHAIQFLDRKGWSAHSFIAPNGINYRCRDDTQGAYHALSHNTDSLGLEFLVPGVHTYSSFLKAISKPYVDSIQYRAGVAQVKYWIKHWGITNIVRHSDIDPDRKVDPGEGFPWNMFLHDIGMS